MHTDNISVKKSDLEMFTFSNFLGLLNYFKENSENLCSCCKHETKCEGEKCPCYEVLGNHAVDEKGNDFYWNRPLTCLDLDFGDCQMYDGTICYDCIHSETGYEGFEWNGKLE